MDHEALLIAAQSARANAYAPYSGYAVGAAVQDESGRIFAGANVENVSFGATLCAERSAIAHMVAAGGKQVRALVVVTQDGGSPCGICRQVLAEFADADCVVISVNEQGTTTQWRFSQLLPFAFDSSAVGHAE